MSNVNTTKILAGVAVMLLLIAAGFFGYTQYEQYSYVKQAVYAEEVASDARDVALECKGLNGNPESEAVKDFLGRVDSVQDNLRKATDALKAARTGSKYRTTNADLVEAMILEENILKIMAKGEPVKVVYPEDGTIVIPSPIAIFTSTQNPEAAKALTNWWLSKEGQEAIVKGWMHSVRDDVNPPKGAPALKTFMNKGDLKAKWDKLAKEMEKIKGEYQKIMDAK